MSNQNMSVPALRRLPLYYRCVIALKEEGKKFISCTDIGSRLELVPIQVRKDLQAAGATGRPKVGYEVDELETVLKEMLGYGKPTDAFIVGMGNLGQALTAHKEFERCGLEIVAAFDTSPLKIGRDYFGKRVFPLNKLVNLAQRMNIKMGIITTPAKSAQDIADIMVEAGIKGIWNFTPVHLNVPDDVYVHNENFMSSLSVLINRIS
ncbi:MAG: redox-sensing transcriptional repressor Rex [Clostridia bacterium]|nr:redox-sensing transcriptional repressor Rex [Clostridia bacterium]